MLRMINAIPSFSTPQSNSGGKGVKCLSFAMISHTVARAWNCSGVASLSGAVMPFFWNLKYSPKQYLATAATFTVATHLFDHYIPIHRLAACAFGLVVSAKLGLAASRDVIAVSLISSALSAGLHVIDNFSTLPAAVHRIAYPLFFYMGTFGSAMIGFLAARSIKFFDSNESQWVVDSATGANSRENNEQRMPDVESGGLNLWAKRLGFCTTLCTISSSYIYDLDGRGALTAYLKRMQQIGAAIFVMSALYYYRYPTRPSQQN